MANFISKCIECQQVKVECKNLAGLLQPIPIREWKWEFISIDFILGFPRTPRQHDEIMVVVDKLSKVANFVSAKSTNSTSEVGLIFIKEIIRLHGVPKNIVFNRDAKFTSKFWRELFASLGIKLVFSISYHP